MRQIPLYQGIGRTCLYSSKARQSGQPGPAALRAGNLLAVVCLSCGTAIAAFVPAPLGQRIVSLFFFGLIPAVGFYASGHILSQLLVLSSELCDMILARCFRYAILLVNDLMSSVGPSVSAKLPALRQKVYYSVQRRYWRVHRAIVDFSCLLIRSAARFIIRMQASQQLKSGQ
jgi:hypothetical protein